LYDQYRLIKHVELLQYPHNIILNFWVELGLLGLIAMLYLLIAVFRKSAVAWASAQPGFTKTALLGVMITLVIMVVHGIVDVPYFKNDLAVQFWVVVALAASCSTRHERQNQVSYVCNTQTNGAPNGPIYRYCPMYKQTPTIFLAS